MELKNRINTESQLFISKIERLSKLGPNRFKELKISFIKMKDLNEIKRTNGLRIIINLNTKLASLKYKQSQSHIQDIIDMMESKYPVLSLEEFHYALKHARWMSFHKKVYHFGNFDATYVAEVMISYEEWMRTKKAQ